MQISFSSIAAVAESTPELVRRILTDVFQALIELSRKTKKEAKLTLKNFGFIHLFTNREVAF